MNSEYSNTLMATDDGVYSCTVENRRGQSTVDTVIGGVYCTVCLLAILRRPVYTRPLTWIRIQITYSRILIRIKGLV